MHSFYWKSKHKGLEYAHKWQILPPDIHTYIQKKKKKQVNISFHFWRKLQPAETPELETRQLFYRKIFSVQPRRETLDTGQTPLNEGTSRVETNIFRIFYNLMRRVKVLHPVRNKEQNKGWGEKKDTTGGKSISFQTVEALLVEWSFSGTVN